MKNIPINKASNQIRLLDKDSPFAVREAFNQLRTNLMYTFSGSNGCPIYGITSVTEESGKSTVITNLALSFTQINKKVLLIDGDMRCPVINTFFGLDPQYPGLSELISGIESDVIVKDIEPNLDIITSGRIPPNPSELLFSPKLKELLSTWKKDYDIIFIDFPPIGLVTDAVSVCNDITGYIFNIRAGKNNAKEINSTIESMEQVGAKIIGIILNDYNIKGSGGHYNSSHYSKYNKSDSAKFQAPDANGQSADNSPEKGSADNE